MRERCLVYGASRENDCAAIGGREGENQRDGAGWVRIAGFASSSLRARMHRPPEGPLLVFFHRLVMLFESG
jgi:hypothetical protein